jgi:hypothetical protein
VQTPTPASLRRAQEPLHWMEERRQRRRAFPRWHSLSVILCVGSAACAWIPREIPVDPQSTFAAYTVSDALFIEKMESGQQGRLVLSDSLPFEHDPQLVIKTSQGPLAGLWIEDPDIVVRPIGDSSGPGLGRVHATWDDGAIQLTLTPEDNATYHTTAFSRLGEGAPGRLGQAADMTVDLRGVYVATVSDAQGAEVGWMRVQIGVNWGPMRLYQGVLPAAINGPLAVAAVARLERQIKQVLAQAVNPYIGN